MPIDWGNVINAASAATLYYFVKKKVEAEGQKVNLGTSSPEQVERLETRVMGLQRDMAAVKEKLNEVLPQDDRGPS